MKISYLIPCRDKEERIRKALECAFNQSCEDLEIVISDHSSTDNSLAIIYEMVDSYVGPHSIKVLKCEDTSFRGTAGLNVHLNYIMSQLDTEAVILTSCDNESEPDMAARFSWAYRCFQPDYVTGRVRFYNDGIPKHESPWFEGPSRFLSFGENLSYHYSLQCSPSWTMGLWNEIGKLEGIEAVDLLLPCLASLKGKLFGLDEILCRENRVADPYACSTERAIQATQSENEILQLTEVNSFHFASLFFSLADRLDKMGIDISLNDRTVLVNKCLTASAAWAKTRENLTMAKIPPLAMRV